MEDNHPSQCTGLREAPLILEIVKEKEERMRDEEDEIRDPTNQIRSLQKRKTPMRKNTGKIRRTKYDSPGPWERPLVKPQNVPRNLHQSMNMRNTRISGFG